jgi:hypothetical protein
MNEIERRLRAAVKIMKEQRKKEISILANSDSGSEDKKEEEKSGLVESKESEKGDGDF